MHRIPGKGSQDAQELPVVVLRNPANRLMVTALSALFGRKFFKDKSTSHYPEVPALQTAVSSQLQVLKELRN